MTLDVLCLNYCDIIKQNVNMNNFPDVSMSGIRSGLRAVLRGVRQ